MAFLPSKGIKIEYSSNLVTPSYTELGCIKSTDDLLGIEALFVDHFCLSDPPATQIIEKYPTGFIQVDDVTVKVGGTNMRQKFDAMFDFCVAGTKLLWRLTWRLDATQSTPETTASSGTVQAYVGAVRNYFDDSGGEQTFDITLKRTSLPTFTPGS